MSDSRQTGGTVLSVASGAASAAGLAVGDVVVAVDGEPVRDVLDWLWMTEESEFTLNVLRDSEQLRLEVTRDPGEPLGVAFTDALFDGVRQCDNACAFCFVAGLPKGLRPSLYIRDDDFRLSFLSGNFVTLTNVNEDDVARIIGQRLSPLHVSVHAVDSDVRARLICPTAGDSALEVLDRLLRAGIEVHVQIVLVPGVNDGAVLDRTLAYLSEREGVLSVGCVPMGYTSHQSRFRESYDGRSAGDVLADIGRWQERMRPSRETGWVYAADEFYLLAGAPVPDAADYDGFPQFENGIGMVSAFRDEFVPPAGAVSRAATLVTGELFAPVLETLVGSAGWPEVRVLSVPNRLFGGNVGVTGLLGGADIRSAIVADGASGTYLVPDVVVNSDGLLLDDVPAGALADLCGASIRIVGSDAGSLIDTLTTDEGWALLR